MRTILEKLEYFASGETRLANTSINFYEVMEEAISTIKFLQKEKARLEILVPQNNRIKIRFVGDVHGKINDYVKIVQDCERSVQVGDFGAGFVKMPILDPHKHKFIRGNHDNPNTCKTTPNWIKDGEIEDNILYVGGAFSIDRNSRVEGINWWSDEELTIVELNEIIDKAEIYQPKIIVSHDCPTRVAEILFGKKPLKTRTQDALAAVFNVCQPKIWVFGHWHEDKDQIINNCRFICLNELSYIDLEV